MINTTVIEEELDRLYKFDMDKYISECNKWKKLGYKIYRNSEGIHKVIVNPQIKEREERDKLKDMLGGDIGNIFGDIFYGRK